jgi:hypothetical protein
MYSFSFKLALNHHEWISNMLHWNTYLIQLFAAFAFADWKSLGFDPTIQPVMGSKGQFDITVHPDNDKKNPWRFRPTRILSSCGAERLWG